MKALQIASPMSASVVDLPTPEPKDKEVLVRVRAVTTCPHWDIAIFTGNDIFDRPDYPKYPYLPGRPGHEMAGEVVAVGPDATSLAPGDRVVAWKDPGELVPGCYASHVVYEEDWLLKLPADAGFEDYAALELAMCVMVSFQDLERIGAVEGRVVGVSGLGGAGLIAAQYARALGAREVVALDVIEDRLDFAREHGVADRYVNPASAEGEDLLEGRGALDTAVDCTGVKKSVQFMLDATRDVVTLFGVAHDTYDFLPRHRSKGVKLFGYGPHNRKAAERALELAIDGRLNLSMLVSGRETLASYEEAVKALQSKQAIKICLVPT